MLLFNMFSSLGNLNKKRQRLLAKAPPGALKDFLSIPFPSLNCPIEEVPLLALDVETTGLNANRDHLLSIGFVELNAHAIKLSTSQHYIISCATPLDADNVAIHQITAQETQSGIDLSQAIEALLKALAGKVMLAHYCKIEQQFLQAACLRLYGVAPVFPIIDTLNLAKQRLDKQHTAYDPSVLRLVNLRKQYKLPAHYAHNALNDAIATGELLLAELAHYQNLKTPLKQLLK